MKVAFHTLGCKLNYAETSTIGQQFAKHEFKIVDFNQPSDVYVINTCSVTERADRECRQIIRRVRRNSPTACIVVVGCYSQLNPDEVASIEGVDLVLGSVEKLKIFDYVRDFSKRSTPQIFVSCIDDVLDAQPAYSADIGGRTRAFLKIQDGCDFNCSFCTIPLARGGSRSVSSDIVLQQARHLVVQGYREIVLTGVNVGDYGKKNGSNLFKLLKALEIIEGVERIRVSSIEPNLLTKEMIDHILRSERICNHFHIPLQSGSDTVLKQMRRRYLSGEYYDLVEYIKATDPDACIGADVIVGFPGETDGLFEETYNFIHRLPISYLHVFTYSERSHTRAVEFSHQVEPKDRFKRNELLRSLGQIKKRKFYSSFIGKTMPVLFESNVQNHRMSGLTKNYVRVESESDIPLINEIHNVKIEGFRDNVCFGSLKTTYCEAEWDETLKKFNVLQSVRELS
ncbi:MAG TPA: tRNA (N(6)-L-threonylcarbamoyladenosine(37)-C(2))-methylthiotransferase MtaB [Bacteroidota bacterium]|nr:tRNA (N(6)-L-threonylcarbamoyladenosine(37)-C(2))-methylthiotransferase MtaB [Bacteroidota bacterium]